MTVPREHFHKPCRGVEPNNCFVIHSVLLLSLLLCVTPSHAVITVHECDKEVRGARAVPQGISTSPVDAVSLSTTLL